MINTKIVTDKNLSLLAKEYGIFNKEGLLVSWDIKRSGTKPFRDYMNEVNRQLKILAESIRNRRIG